MSRPLEGYPTSHGNQRVSVFPHTGPASYTQVAVVAGTVPCTGGDTVTGLAEAGVGFVDAIMDAVSDDGAFSVEAIPITASNPSSLNSSALSGIPTKTWKLRWIARFTGAFGGQNQTVNTEVVAATNLSTICVRLLVIGPK